MANETNQFTQIFELKSLGYDALSGQLKEVVSLLNELKRVKADVGANKTRLFDPVELDNINKKIKDLSTTQDQLITKIRSSKTETDKTVSAYVELVNKYKEADAATKELAADFGVNSVEARKAAESAAMYKQQLVEIDKLRKTGGVTPNAPVLQTEIVPVKEAEILRETGVAVNELDLAEAEAANSATAWAAAEIKAAEGVKAVRETAVIAKKAVEDLTTPYQALTGTLQENVLKQNDYKATVAGTAAQLKILEAETSAADKQTVGYKNKVAALTIENNKAKLASAELGQTINAQQKYLAASTTSSDKLSLSVGLMRNAFRQMSEEQKASPLGQQILKDIQAADVQIKKSDATIGNYQRNVGNYAQKAFGVIRQAAYILPGIGIAGIMNLIYEGITLVVDKLMEANKGINTLKANITNLNEVSANANKEAGAMISTLKILYGEATNPAKSIEQRTAAVVALKKEFPDFFANINNEIILNGKAKNAYDLLTASIISTSRAKAAKAKIDELEAKRLDADFQKAKIIGTTEGDKARLNNRPANTDPATLVTQNIISKQDQLKIINDRRKKSLDEVDKVVKSLDQQEAFLLNYVGSSTIAKALEEKVKKTAKADRLTVDDKNSLNILDGQLKTAVANEEARITELKKLHNLSYDEEREYISTIALINVAYLNRKIAFLEGQKSLNAKEKEQLAVFHKERADLELKAQQDIDAIDKKQYSERQTALKEEFEGRQDLIRDLFQQQKQDAENNAAAVINAPTAKAADKTAAKLKEDEDIRNAQIKFNADMDALEKELGFHSRKNAEDRKLELEKLDAAIKTDIANNTKAIIEQQLKDTGEAAANAISEIKRNIAEQTIGILNDDKLSNTQKAERINKVGTDAQPSILSNEIAELKIQLPFYEDLLDAKFITEKEYFDKVADLRTKEAALLTLQNDKENANLSKTQQFFNTAIGNITGFFKGVQATQASINAAMDEAAGIVNNAIQDAVSNHFEAQQRQIDKERELAQDRMDLQKEQVLNTAQSQAEKDSIERQFQLKAEEADKIAGEKRKKIAIKQMAIEFGLASIKTLAEYPFPYSLIPLGALTLAYLVKLADVKNQTFAQGGNPDLETVRGGIVKGRPHSAGGNPFLFKGRVFEDEIGELNIIRTKNVDPNKKQTISGTHTEIASALNRLGGGKDFKPGATVQRFDYGGSLGASLQAPIYTTNINQVSANGNESLVEVITLMNSRLLEVTKATNERIDKLTVYQDTRTVEAALNKRVKQNNIGKV